MFKFNELSDKAKILARNYYLVIHQIDDDKLTDKQIDNNLALDCEDWRFKENGVFIYK